MTGMGLELEVKLVVPTAARGAVRRAFGVGTPRAARAIGLRALYFDTAARSLASAGMALRVRRQGRRWVQTLKVAQAGELARAEYDIDRTEGTIDPLALESTPALRALRDAGGLAALQLRYETAIRRRTRQVRVRGGVVELAFDEGWITAGDRRLPVCEVEVELLRGRASAVFEVAGRWQRRFGLVVDPRTKAERGDRLAEGATQALPRKAATVRLARAMTPVQALRVIAAECADQVVRNAADLALGVGGDDHVHQLRVGLRRLRSAWRFFDGWTPPPPEALVQGAQALFTEMGHCRDASVQTGEVVTRLLAAGMPGNPTVHASPARPAAQVASDTQTQAWLLSLYQWAEDLREPESPPATEAAEGPAAAGAEAASPPRPDLRRLVMRRLRRWHGRLAVGGQAFRDLPAEQQHLLRKRAKRLRYAAEFAATLMAAKPLERYLGRLARLQAVLGELNDLEVARERYGQPGATDPAIWFAQGWIAAMREALLANAAREFDKLGQAGPDGR